jgi:hypothetical protein
MGKGYGIKCDTCGALVWYDDKTSVKAIQVPKDWFVVTRDNYSTYHCSYDCAEVFYGLGK